MFLCFTYYFFNNSIVVPALMAANLNFFSFLHFLEAVLNAVNRLIAVKVMNE